MHENYDTEEYVLATLSYEGEVFDRVAVQFKGQTSYRKALGNGSEKLSFSLKLDEIIDGQDIEGYNNFNLNNAYGDASFMKEVLYARLSRNHVPAVRANFIRLYLNGEELCQPHYTLKDSDMDDPWGYLVDSMEKYMDLDGILWFLAQEILFSDDDSYVMKGKMWSGPFSITKRIPIIHCLTGCWQSLN